MTNFKVFALAPEDQYRIYLTIDSQMDKYLERGFTLWYEYDGGNTKLLATPEDGFLDPKPTLVTPFRK